MKLCALHVALLTGTTTSLTEGDILARIEAVEAKNAEMKAENAEITAKNAEVTAKYAEIQAENAEIKAMLTRRPLAS